MKNNRFISTLCLDINMYLYGTRGRSHIRKLYLFAHPRLLPILLLRISEGTYTAGWLFHPIAYFVMWLNVILFGIEVSPKLSVGGGLLLPHSHGVVLGARKIGNNVTIFQGVTLGAKTYDRGYDALNRPLISDGVILGAGCKVLGGVVIGENTSIGANSVVTKDVPANSIAIGVPAQIYMKKN